ncbi:ABC transporter ATP-binding protein [Xylanimonas oleitrophica]|uniref:ABC transporter ATP-binding protein n=1 Tax=Xylanimonas oleitrophica TaxID=2607479 RepID=A0A2W5WM19_9MICO|nr:ABC transporter ATP-binding protein [Xylanimonas oleitrophica]PZR52357.1 ABC transporter ATP-binding protein [Xylanimonas oleitrophica]
MSTSPVVEVHHLRKLYGDRPAAPPETSRPGAGTREGPGVHDVSFTVAEGEIFGILGPNGAGKTTTVELVAGMRTADGGTVRVLGNDPQAHPEAVREALGVQLQESQLHAKITVAEALRLFASFYPAPADTEELLHVLDLADQRDTRFDHLSGGQKQRLSIALALVGNPKVAILDELTTGLDPAARRATWDFVERVRDRGVTILLVTHFMDEAERLCDRLVVIDGGRVVAEGTPAELVDTGERTVRLRVADRDHDRALALLVRLADTDDHVFTVTDVRTDQGRAEIEVLGSRRVLFSVVPALAAADLVPDDVRTVPRTLEDVFVDLTGRTYEEVGS